MKVVLNLGNSFHNMAADVRKELGSDAELIVLALKRDAEPNKFRDTMEPPLLERSGAKDSGARIVFIDDPSFNASAFGRQLRDAVVVMNGGTSRHGHASVRIFDGLEHGRLIDLQRDGLQILEEK